MRVTLSCAVSTLTHLFYVQLLLQIVSPPRLRFPDLLHLACTAFFLVIFSEVAMESQEDHTQSSHTSVRQPPPGRPMPTSRMMTLTSGRGGFNAAGPTSSEAPSSGEERQPPPGRPIAGSRMMTLTSGRGGFNVAAPSSSEKPSDTVNSSAQ